MPIGLKVGAFLFLVFFFVPAKIWFFLLVHEVFYLVLFSVGVFLVYKKVSLKKFDDFFKNSMIFRKHAPSSEQHTQ